MSKMGLLTAIFGREQVIIMAKENSFLEVPKGFPPLAREI